MRGHISDVYCIGVSLDSVSIVSGSADKTIKIWNIIEGAVIRSLQQHSNMVISVGFSEDGTRIVSGSYDKTVKIWNA